MASAFLVSSRSHKISFFPPQSLHNIWSLESKYPSNELPQNLVFYVLGATLCLPISLWNICLKKAWCFKLEKISWRKELKKLCTCPVVFHGVSLSSLLNTAKQTLLINNKEANTVNYFPVAVSRQGCRLQWRSQCCCDCAYEAIYFG